MGYMQVTATGRMVTDPELKEVSAGKHVAKMRAAFTNKVGQDGSSLFVDVEAWDDLAKNCVSTLKKGSPVVITGRLKEDSWENKEGEKKSKMKIVASDIGEQISPWADDKKDSDKPQEVEEELF